MYESLHSFYYDPHTISPTPAQSILLNPMGTTNAAQAPLSPIQISSSSTYSMKHPLHAPSRRSNFATAISSSTTPPTPCRQGPEKKYVLFGILDQDPHKLTCIDVPCRRSHHAHTCRVYSEERDSDFFRDLRETYRSLMGLKRFFLPYTLHELCFVKVSRINKLSFPLKSARTLNLIIL